MNIKYLVVHCADTPNHRDVTAAEVHRWHKDRGWDGIGYSAFIRRDGTLEQGRPDYWQGAHVEGHNHEALGICLAGIDFYTPEQWAALEGWLVWKKELYPDAEVVGHNVLDSGKTCPNFDVKSWWAIASAKHPG